MKIGMYIGFSSQYPLLPICGRIAKGKRYQLCEENVNEGRQGWEMRKKVKISVQRESCNILTMIHSSWQSVTTTHCSRTCKQTSHSKSNTGGGLNVGGTVNLIAFVGPGVSLSPHPSPVAYHINDYWLPPESSIQSVQFCIWQALLPHHSKPVEAEGYEATVGYGMLLGQP